jgi:hypothetical protein
VPDAKWIRKEIPIADVARAIGLQGDGRVFDCFREHPRGKRQHSLRVHAISNTARCFTCDTRNLSNIDLVMKVHGYDVGTAIRWLSKTFKDVPFIEVRVKSGRRTYAPSRKRSMTLQDLVTSPGWAALSPAAKAVLTAIFARCPASGSEQGCLHCTYVHLMQWTGLRSRATIAASLHQLRDAGAIQTSTAQTNFRTRRGFWLKELVVRVSPRAMRAQRRVPKSATSFSVQSMNSQYAVQNLNSAPEFHQDRTSAGGQRVQ